MSENLLETPSSPLPEGVFLLPVCTNRVNFSLMLSALDAWHNDDNDVRVLVDYLNAQNAIERPELVTCGGAQPGNVSLQWDCLNWRVRVLVGEAVLIDWQTIPCMPSIDTEQQNCTNCADTCTDCDDCSSDCEENDMGCCISDLRWQNGVLQKLRCGEWSDVPGYVALPPQTTDETVTPAETPEQAAEWACRKAQAIVDKFWVAANYALDHWADVTGFISGMNTAVGVTLNWNWQLYLQEYCFAIDTIELDTFVTSELTDANKRELICTLSKRLDGSNNDIGENQTQIIKDTFGEKWGALDNAIMFTFTGDVLGCFGREEWRAITRNSALLYTDDCCPEVIAPILPPGTTWAHEYRFDIYASGWSFVGQGATRVDGQGVVSTMTDNFQAISGARKNAPSPQAASTLRYVRLEYTAWPNNLAPSVGSWAYHNPNIINKVGQFWGRSVIEFECAETINQGEELQLGNATVYGPDPLPSGTSVLRRVVIAGTGQDLFPADPQYTDPT